MLDGFKFVFFKVLSSHSCHEKRQKLLFLDTPFLFAISLILVFNLRVNNLLNDVFQGDQADFLEIIRVNMGIIFATCWVIVIVLSLDFRDDSQVSAAFLKAWEYLQAGSRVVDVHNLAKHARQLPDRYLVTIWAEQDQVFRHKNANNIWGLAIVDWNATEPLRVDHLTNFTINDCIDIKGKDVFNGNHYLADSFIA